MFSTPCGHVADLYFSYSIMKPDILDVFKRVTLVIRIHFGDLILHHLLLKLYRKPRTNGLFKGALHVTEMSSPSKRLSRRLVLV